MVGITYSLKSVDGESFYEKLSSFTDKIIKESELFLYKDIETVSGFFKEEFADNFRTEHEYIVEYISLGICIDKYAAYAINTGTWSTSGMEYLFNLRKKSSTLRPYVDNVRGVLSAHLLYKKSENKAPYTKEMIYKLIAWMKASGEFKEEVKRFSQWAFYLASLSDAEVASFISRNIAFARYFEEQAKYYLGEFTTGVSRFLKNEHKTYKYREDYLFCGKSEVEYHINMFGAEVLNRELRVNFEKTSKKVLLLPTCMAKPADGNCKAAQSKNRMACAGCSRECRINQIRQNMLKIDVETCLIPHSSGFSEFLKYWRDQKETGLIGVGCVLNLLSGGYEMQRLNIPSQCVFLEYSGCKKHWHNTGIPTNINIHQLHHILAPVKKETIATNF